MSSTNDRHRLHNTQQQSNNKSAVSCCSLARLILCFIAELKNLQNSSQKKHIEPSNQLAAHNGELSQINSLLFFSSSTIVWMTFGSGDAISTHRKNETTKLFYRFSMQIEARSRSVGAKKKDATSPPNDDLVATFFRHRCEACDSSVTRFEFHAAKKDTKFNVNFVNINSRHCDEEGTGYTVMRLDFHFS